MVKKQDPESDHWDKVSQSVRAYHTEHAAFLISRGYTHEQDVAALAKRIAYRRRNEDIEKLLTEKPWVRENP